MAAMFDWILAGLHCGEGQARQVPAALGRPLPGEAIPQGSVPHRGATGVQPDDARSEQWQEAVGCPHRQALF